MTTADADYSTEIRALEKILLRMGIDDASTLLQSVDNECDIYFEVQTIGAWVIKYRMSGIIFNNCDIIFSKMEIDAKIVFNNWHHFWNIVNNNDGSTAVSFDKSHVMREGIDDVINLFYRTFTRALNMSCKSLLNINNSGGGFVNNVNAATGGSNNTNTIVSQIRSPLSRKGTTAADGDSSSILAWDANNNNNNNNNSTNTNSTSLNQYQQQQSSSSNQQQAPPPLPILLKQGYLFKKRDVFNGWRQRYCKLYYGRLEYFVNENDAVPRGIIDLYESRAYLPVYQTVSIAGSDHWAIIIEPKSWLEKVRLASAITDSVTGRIEAVQWEQCLTQAASRPYGGNNSGVNSSSIIASYAVGGGGGNNTNSNLHRSAAAVAAVNDSGSGSSKATSLSRSQHHQQPWQLRDNSSISKANRANGGGGVQKSQARTGAKSSGKEITSMSTNTTTTSSSVTSTMQKTTATVVGSKRLASSKNWKKVTKGLIVILGAGVLAVLYWSLRVKQRASVSMSALAMLLFLLLAISIYIAYTRYKKDQQNEHNESTSVDTSKLSQQHKGTNNAGSGSSASIIQMKAMESKSNNGSSSSNNDSYNKNSNSNSNSSGNNKTTTSTTTSAIVTDTTTKERKRILVVPTTAAVMTSGVLNHAVAAQPPVTTATSSSTHSVTNLPTTAIVESFHNTIAAGATATTTSSSVTTATGDGVIVGSNYHEYEAVSSDGNSSYNSTPTTSDRQVRPNKSATTNSQPTSPKENKQQLSSNIKTGITSNNSSGNSIVSFGKRAVTFTAPGSSGNNGSGNSGVVNNLLSFRNSVSSTIMTYPRDSLSPSTSPRPNTATGIAGADISSPSLATSALERGSVSLTSSPVKSSPLSSSLLLPLPLGAKFLSQTSTSSSINTGTIQQLPGSGDVNRSSVTSSLDRSIAYQQHQAATAGNSGSRRRKLSNSIQAIFKIKPQQSTNSSSTTGGADDGVGVGSGPNTHQPRSLMESPSLEKWMSGSVDIIDFENYDVTTEDVAAVGDDSITYGHHHVSNSNYNSSNDSIHHSASPQASDNNSSTTNFKTASTAVAIEEHKNLLRNSSFSNKFNFNFNNKNSTVGSNRNNNNTVTKYAKGIGNGIRNVAAAGGGMIRMERAQSSRVISTNGRRKRSESMDCATLDTIAPPVQQDSEYGTIDTSYLHTSAIPPLRQSSSRRRNSMSALSSQSSSYSSDSSNLANFL